MGFKLSMFSITINEYFKNKFKLILKSDHCFGPDNLWQNRSNDILECWGRIRCHVGVECSSGRVPWAGSPVNGMLYVENLTCQSQLYTCHSTFHTWVIPKISIYLPKI